MVLGSGTIKSLGITSLFLKNLWSSQWLPERKKEGRGLGYFGHYEKTSESDGKNVRNFSVKYVQVIP